MTSDSFSHKLIALNLAEYARLLSGKFGLPTEDSDEGSNEVYRSMSRHLAEMRQYGEIRLDRHPPPFEQLLRYDKQHQLMALLPELTFTPVPVNIGLLIDVRRGQSSLLEGLYLSRLYDVPGLGVVNLMEHEYRCGNEHCYLIREFINTTVGLSPAILKRYRYIDHQKRLVLSWFVGGIGYYLQAWSDKPWEKLEQRMLELAESLPNKT